ncbi:MAG: hydroxymethylbilane synthase [Acidimicrobiales bacterium]|nr:hydroxymethylbilane synthase [Acidimicrobiales bacterium]
MSTRLRAATRGSALALWQTRHVASLLGRDLEEVVVSTVGDRELNVPIHTMGGKGVFVKEVQAALLDGRADIAVHSGKDLPARTPPELTLVAVPTRADARDALIGSTWDALPTGARVATGSVRRRAQLAWHRPDLVFSELRGNIQTRLEKLASGGFDVIVMAAAALDRLELALDAEVDRLDPSIMVPQVAQGALAIECRADDTATIEALQAIQDPATRRVVDAERAFLDELGGDCDLPAGAHAVLDRDGTIEIVGMLSSLDGRVLIRERRRGDDPDVLGREVARFLLDERGGTDLLADTR